MVVLTERGLWRLDDDRVTPVATITDKPSPFAAVDLYELYAGGQRGGALWRLAR